MAELVDALVSNTNEETRAGSIPALGTNIIFLKKQEKYDRAYLKMAQEWAKLSHCTRKKVGALIVKDRMIISDGYNGTPSGFENNCEDENGETKWYVLHAEANAIAKVAQSNESSTGASIFCTHMPCIECAKLIHQAGITEVYYRIPYEAAKGSGREFLEKSNISLHHVEATNGQD